MCCKCNILLKRTMPQCFWKYMKLVFIQATVRFMSSVERSRPRAKDGKKWTHFERETSTWLFSEYFGKTRISRMPQPLYFRHHSSAVTFPLVWPHAHQRRTFPGRTDKDLPPVLSRTSDKAGPGVFLCWRPPKPGQRGLDAETSPLRANS